MMSDEAKFSMWFLTIVAVIAASVCTVHVVGVIYQAPRQLEAYKACIAASPGNVQACNVVRP